VNRRRTAWTLIGVAAAGAITLALALEAPAERTDAPPVEEAPVEEAPVEDLAIFDTDDRSIVKRGRNNVCRDRNDLGFDDVLHFRAYRSKEDCLRSGGREPR
jgi:hypothetical protein